MKQSLLALCDNSEVCVESPSDRIMEIFELFVHDGFVSHGSNLNNATPVKILRDTGRWQILCHFLISLIRVQMFLLKE